MTDERESGRIVDAQPGRLFAAAIAGGVSAAALLIR